MQTYWRPLPNTTNRTLRKFFCQYRHAVLSRFFTALQITCCMDVIHCIIIKVGGLYCFFFYNNMESVTPPPPEVGGPPTVTLVKSPLLLVEETPILPPWFNPSIFCVLHPSQQNDTSKAASLESRNWTISFWMHSTHSNFDESVCHFINVPINLFLKKSLWDDLKIENNLHWCMKNVGQTCPTRVLILNLSTSPL